MAKQTPTASERSIRLNVLLLKCMYISFILLITVKTLVWPPLNRAPNAIVWLLQLIPILAFSYGVLTERRRQIAGFCYVLLIYFVGIGANMFVPDARFYNWTGLALVTAMYVSGMMHVRWTRAGVAVSE